jgi:type II secretory pathway component PulC
MRSHSIASKVAAILTSAIALVVFPAVFAVADEPVTTEQAPANGNSEESLLAGPAVTNLQGELDLLLLGTVVIPEDGKALAIIQIGDKGEQTLYRLGDIVEGARVTKILRDSVTLTFADSEVELRLVGDTGGTPLAAAILPGDDAQPQLSKSEHGFWQVEQENLNDLSGVPEILSDVQYMGGEGATVIKVRANGILHKLGLQQGDIILTANSQFLGKDLSLQQALVQSSMGEPMGHPMLRLEVDRQGELNVHYYQFDAQPGTSGPESRQN